MQLLNLPSEIVSASILPFLTLHAVVNVDTSVANRELRKQWLLCLPTFHNSGSYTINSTQYRALMWTCNRGIKFSAIEVSLGTETRMVDWLLESELDWSRISKLTLNFNNNISRVTYSSFLWQFTELQDLVMHMRDLAAAETILSTARRLRSVRMTTDAPDQMLAFIGEYQPDLESIHLINCTKLTELVLCDYLTQARNLRTFHLNVMNCSSDNVLAALGNNCGHLQTLYVSGRDTGELTDIGFVALAAGCPDLRSIHMTGYSKATDAGFVALVAGCPLLRTIKLSSCLGLGDRSMCAIAQHCSQLQVLNISQCKFVTDMGVTAVAQSCTVLRECIILSHIKQISDVSVLAIVKHCPRLTILEACCCPLLTDVSITAVLQQCKWIAKMYALGCPELTPACLAPLEEWSAVKCSAPKGMMAVSPTNFTANEKEYFEQKFPFLTVC